MIKLLHIEQSPPVDLNDLVILGLNYAILVYCNYKNNLFPLNYQV